MTLLSWKHWQASSYSKKPLGKKDVKVFCIMKEICLEPLWNSCLKKMYCRECLDGFTTFHSLIVMLHHSRYRTISRANSHTAVTHTELQIGFWHQMLYSTSRLLIDDQNGAVAWFIICIKSNYCCITFIIPLSAR